MAKKTKKAAPQSRETASIKSFLDMIAPSVVKFEPDHFICGNTFRCVWALREYPTQTDEQAILRHLGEKDGITLRIYTRQVTPAEEKRIIQNAANKNRMGSSNTNDLQQTITAESNLQDVASLVISSLGRYGMSIMGGKVSFSDSAATAASYVIRVVCFLNKVA